MTIAIIIGLVAFGVGLYLWLRRGPDQPEVEPSEFASDWTGDADPTNRWGDHVAQEDRKP